jgi:EAL domain-containing protein (putative c-di-GMP-specific phosphodiesterase class I)
VSGCTRLQATLQPGALAVVFQPIVEFRATRRRLHGLEALVRAPKAAGFVSADALFEHARRRGEEDVLDRVAAEAILRAAATLPIQPLLSMNVHASTLGSDHSFLAHLSRVAEEHSFPDPSHRRDHRRSRRDDASSSGPLQVYGPPGSGSQWTTSDSAIQTVA